MSLCFDVSIIEITDALAAVYASTSMEQAQAAMTSLEEITRNYQDESDLIDRCSWYHDVIGFTWADGSCINEEEAEDEDCPQLTSYVDSIEVAPHLLLKSRKPRVT